MLCRQSVIAEAKKIWKEHDLESYIQKAIASEEEWWPDHEWDPTWGDVWYDDWVFSMNDASDFVYFTSPNGEQGEFLINEV